MKKFNRFTILVFVLVLTVSVSCSPSIQNTVTEENTEQNTTPQMPSNIGQKNPDFQIPSTWQNNTLRNTSTVSVSFTSDDISITISSSKNPVNITSVKNMIESNGILKDVIYSVDSKGRYYYEIIWDTDYKQLEDGYEYTAYTIRFTMENDNTASFSYYCSPIENSSTLISSSGSGRTYYNLRLVSSTTN